MLGSIFFIKTVSAVERLKARLVNHRALTQRSAVLEVA